MTSPDKYKTIGFDYGGVLCGPPSSVFDDRIAKFLGVDTGVYRRAYFAHNTKSIPLDEIWHLVLRDSGTLVGYNELSRYLKNVRESKMIDKLMIQLVDSLRSDGYKVGLLSNNSKEKAQLLRQQNVDSHFDAFCVSGEIGYLKPSKEAFECLVAELGASLDSLIFIDDEPVSIQNAERDGYQAILFRSYDSLLNELRHQGIL